jgi:hypothetical protein
MENECKATEQEDSIGERKCSGLGPYGKCTAEGGKFPYLMCSLKRIEETDVGALEYYPNSSDWTSGVINAQGAPPTASQVEVEAFPMNELCQI